MFKVVFLRFICFLIFCGASIKALAQPLVYSDCVKGGVVGDGYYVGFGNTSADLYIDIPVGCNVKKAILFSEFTRSISDGTLPFNHEVSINSNIVNLLGVNSISNTQQHFTDEISRETILTDVTNIVSSSVLTYTFDPMVETVASEPPYYSSFYLLVVFENTTYETMCIDVIVNNQNVTPLMSYTHALSNPVNANFDIGLSVHAWGICDDPTDWYEVSVNNNVLGQIGGVEPNCVISCGGMHGTFEYHNGEIIGIGNDIGNAFMNGLDGVADIQSYINGNDPFTVSFQQLSNNSSNSINQLYFTYTTTCDTFSVTMPNDTILCQGEQLQLNVEGGQSVQWEPAIGLSCADCPNPVFTADSSMFYSVRIWNNDSCSVVRPLKINVRSTPEWDSVSAIPSDCGTNNGTLALNAVDNGAVTQWNWNGNTSTAQPIENLATGNYIVSFVDTNGCVSNDSIVFVEEINTTLAQFTASPTEGSAPLEVSIENASENATNYTWFVNDEEYSNDEQIGSVVLDTSGTHNIELIAWQYDPACTDTFALSIFVYDSLVVRIGNAFTPNGDNNNDFFGIFVNNPVDAEVVLLNRWGNVVYEYKGGLTPGVNDLWDGNDASDGTYFYKIRIIYEGEEVDFDGFVMKVD